MNGTDTSESSMEATYASVRSAPPRIATPPATLESRTSTSGSSTAISRADLRRPGYQPYDVAATIRARARSSRRPDVHHAPHRPRPARAAPRLPGRARDPAGAHGLHPHARLDRRRGGRPPACLHLRRGGPHGDGVPGGSRAAPGRAGLRLHGPRRPAARVGDEPARPQSLEPRLRARPDAEGLRARRPHGPDLLSLRRPPLRARDPARAA